MSKGRVAARGFDLLVDGRSVAYAAGQRVPQEHAELVTNEKIWTPRDSDLAELERVKNTNSALTEDFFEEYGGGDEEVDDEFGDLTVDQLKEYAQENEIDLSGASKKAEILAVIREAD